MSELNQELQSLLDLSSKKKSKVKRVTKDETVNDEEPVSLNYQQLLKRLYGNMKVITECCSGQAVFPRIVRVGVRKTGITNMKAVCDSIHRNVDELGEYLDKTLHQNRLKASRMKENNVFMLEGRYNPNQIEQCLISFINRYVVCNMCKTVHTNYVSSGDRRSNYLTIECAHCKAKRNIAKHEE